MSGSVRRRYAWATTAGPRPDNQDRVRACTVHTPVGAAHLLVLADGMGGQDGGALASELAVRTVLRCARRALVRPLSDTPLDEDWLAATVREANRRVHRLAGRMGLTGMGTTLTVLVDSSEAVLVANVGDSRCYRAAAGDVTQLTQDHSAGADAVRRGLVAEAQLHGYPYAHALTRAIGTDARVEVDVFRLPAFAGVAPAYLLCSDGVWNAVAPAELAQIVAAAGSSREAVDRIIMAALRNGTNDNASAVLIMEEPPARADDAAPEWQTARTAIYRAPSARSGRHGSSILLAAAAVVAFAVLVWQARATELGAGSGRAPAVAPPVAGSAGAYVVTWVGPDSARVLLDGRTVGRLEPGGSLMLRTTPGAEIAVASTRSAYRLRLTEHTASRLLAGAADR